MEFMIALYPAAKLLAGVIVILLLLWLIKRRQIEAAIAVGTLTALLLYLSPVKIDGTEARKAHRVEQQAVMSYQEVRAVSPTNPKVEAHKPTFAERMAAEDARSVKANKVVTDSIN